MVVDQKAKDPNRMLGPHMVKEGIAHNTGEDITRCVAEIHDLVEWVIASHGMYESHPFVIFLFLLFQ